ncbi:Hsp20/alpha crystallin family protein [Rhizobiaceae bacterium n13]|uniref:Hsp20/alpha crystallin family protein n=1 Tax=Ferirhizobium litorale TaxID=2927786 RepID=A0AAE3QEG7_9HYPH|nr:Hsp20/alpha crystallin family protein [Fererhizobium litorale]MDI7861517.1 Hsp20/alpha crystallin family protein [Fererhizobium litorale]MDI7921663.1 Hsp20/alpha crystallin family protein [Fererhizobium litorale]
MNGKSSNFLPSLWSDNPFRDLRKEMDQALESFFGNRGQLGTAAGGEPMFASFRTPSVDVVENETAITLTAELPGMSEGDVDLSVHNGILTLKGEKKLEKKDDKDNYHIIERRYGSFQRSMRLPDTVDEGAINATFDKGVLKVTMPKKAGSAPAERKIAIGKS